MERLKSYFDVIDSRLLHHIKGKPAEFIRLFQEQEYIKEEVFIQRFCDGKYNRSNYQELKSRTIKILQALAIVSIPKGGNLVKKKYEVCQKKFAIGRKFINQGGKRARNEGVLLLKQAYDIAVEFDFTHFASELCGLLYYNYVYYNPDPRIAAFYAIEAEHFLEDYLAEKKAEYRVFYIIGQMKGILQPSEFEEALEQINQQTGRSLKYRIYKSMIEVIYGFKIGDYELIIDSCEKTLQFVKGKKGVYSSHHQFFFSKKAAAQVAIGHYTEAEKNFKEASQYAPRNSSNDYLLRLYRTINALHSGNYQVAYDLYRKNKKCKFVRIREQFTLIEAYMCFLAYMGHIQLEKKFRIGKYLNETFKAQADKEGGNIIILIAELLVYFARNRGKFIDRVESINNYTYRNLQSYHTLRAKCFMKILCAMPSANFNAISLQRKARKHIQYLKEHPIQMGDNVAIEIIPFNHLLDMVMRQLKQKAA